MALVEKIKSLQQQGFREEDIIKALKEEGNPPKDIADALNKSKIKSAIGAPSDYSRDFYDEDTAGMKQSIMTAPSPQEGGGGEMPASDMPQQYSQGQNIGYPQQQKVVQEEQFQQQPQQYEEQQAYSQMPQQQEYQEYSYGQQGGQDSFIDIAEQIAEEKVSDVIRKVDEIEEVKVLLSKKVENLDKRLAKIEETIEKIQLAVLEKVGEYGKNIGDIKREMSMMQDSFSKMIEPVLDKHKKKD